MGDMIYGEIQRHGFNDANGGCMGEILLLPNTEAAKIDSQKPLTSNNWNLIRWNCWYVQKKKTDPRPSLNCLFLAWRNSFWPLNPMSSAGGNSRFFHSWWFWKKCLAFYCVWWEIINSLAWRGQYWCYKPVFASIDNRVGKQQRRRILPGLLVGRTHHLYWPDYWSCVARIYPRCRW